jgi:DNA-binding transcriptional MerR regulator
MIATETKAKRVDWRAWIPIESITEATNAAEPMLTRAELVAVLRDAGEDVTERGIAYWQTRGVIPHPTRRKHGRTIVAIYPAWYPQLIRALRRHQREGMPLRRIGPVLRIMTEQMFTPRPLSDQRQHHIEREEARRAFYALRDEIALRVRKLAGLIEEMDGRRFPAAELRFYAEGDQGGGRSLRFPIDDDLDPSPD